MKNFKKLIFLHLIKIPASKKHTQYTVLNKKPLPKKL
jgi:hypothetical protein